LLAFRAGVKINPFSLLSQLNCLFAFFLTFDLLFRVWGKADKNESAASPYQWVD